jgi:lipopolysaccharide heptosyltransferase I
MPMTSNPDSSLPQRSRILLILMGSIGDVVRALPLLGRIRRSFNTAHIAWVIEPKSLPIVAGHRWLDEVIVYDRAAPWSFPLILNRIRRGRFDLVLDLQRHLKSGVISLASGAHERLGFNHANTKEFNHYFNLRQIPAQPPMRLKLMQYQAFGDALGLPAAPIEFGIEPTEAEQRRARELLADAPRPLLAVILGSSWPSRIYFPESIAAVIRLLATPADGMPALFPLLLGAPEESKLARQVVERMPDMALLNLAGRTTLRDLVPIFTHCAAAFGPDCGPMHIAAAVGCPIVSLWGATAPERSAPWGFAQLALSGEIPCHPCYLRHCPIGRECMRRIAPDEVAATVRKALAAAPERIALNRPGEPDPRQELA